MNGIGIISFFALFLSAAAPGLFALSAFQGFFYPGKNLDASVTLRFGRSEPSAERFYRGLGELVPYFVVLDRNLRGTSPSNHLFIVVDETTVEILRGGVSLVKLPWTATNFSFIKEQVFATIGVAAAAGTTNILFSLQVAFIPAGRDPQRELKRWRRKLPKDLAFGIEIRGDLFGAPLWLHERPGGSRGVRYGLFPDFKEALTVSETLGLPEGSVQVVPVVLDRETIGSMFGRTDR